MSLTEPDQVKEQVRFNTEILKLFVVGLIATIGGIVTLLLGKVDSGAEYVFLIGGMIIAPIFIGIIYNLYSIIRKHIRNGKLF